MQQIINAHCHIYPDKIAERAVEGIKTFYDLDWSLEGTVQGLLNDGAKIGATHYLVHSVATVPRQVIAINEFISSVANNDPKTYTGFGSLHPDSEDIKGDLEHLVELGLKGVKLHPDFQNFDIDGEKGLQMCELISQKDLPVLIHCGDTKSDKSHPKRLKVLLEKLPNLTVIAAHMGGWSCWEDAVSLLPGHNNLYVDTSSSLAWLEPDVTVQYIRTFGVDKVIFGTDYPMWDAKKEMEYFDRLDLTLEEREKILYYNAAKLLGVNNG